ncbi:hypothetical protein FE257_001854 [Aspergillus nanangensis]|uniref:Uncharacterized protein n=1 Tax=Aspergillus nanangensis TaxID=2582783 RepID=A0AAD4CD93_ASPNN|nr:hypothetical protein FE257_001854 [Aspergillus nanangensis]
MTINPTFLAQRTRSSLNWGDARYRVLKSYREWLRAVSGPLNSSSITFATWSVPGQWVV